MKKCFFAFSMSALLIFFITSVWGAGTYTTTQITNNSYWDAHPQINDSGYIVWYGGYSDEEIFLYDGTGTIQLTNNDYYDLNPQINANGYVVWYGGFGFPNGSDDEIFLYDGTTTTQITDNDSHDRWPQINDSGYVVWVRGGEIFLYDGTATTQITNNTYSDDDPQINDNGYVVWVGDHEIFLYDGTATTQITNNTYGDRAPQINDNGYVVWYGGTADGLDYEIFLYDGTSTTRLTNNDYDDYDPQINADGHVVWRGVDSSDYEIFLYDGTTTTQITDNDYDDLNPQINDSGYVVWKGWEGSDAEIFLYDGTTTTQITDNDYDDLYAQINAKGHVVWCGESPDGPDYEIFLAAPTCECTLVPDTIPTVIQRGGTLGFQASITNNTGGMGTVLFGTKVTRPDATQTGFIWGPLHVYLNPRQTKSGHKIHTIPMGFELGTYTYHGYIGRYGNVYNECQFDFEVVSSTPTIEEYSNSGCLQAYLPCGDDQIEVIVEARRIHVTHWNAIHNCCPDDIQVSLSPEGNILRLTETEILSVPCTCLCCYYVEATVGSLSPGTYTVEYCWDDETGPECYTESVVVP